MYSGSEALDIMVHKHQKLVHETTKYRGVLDTLKDQYADCIIAVEDAAQYLEYKDEVAEALKALHRKSVEKARVLYEDVLTGLLKDIFPNDPENERVHLDLSVKRGQAALNIEVASREGFRRDVSLDKGASVRSILAIGLRFIALSRSNRRRLVVLDEADQEINEIFIPRFAKMVAQLASRIGMQVIYISHKGHEHFEGHARIIRLSREGDRVTSDIISDKASTEVVGWDGEKHIGAMMEGTGITDIRLVNVKQHENTHIEFSPLVNVLCGTNDLGKTTVLQAIECVARNKGREGMIRDHKDRMRIELGIENGQRIVFEHKRRSGKNGKTLYEFYNKANKPTLDSHDGKSCPDWLHSHLGMELHKGFDLHIGLKNANTFMFESGFSEHKRAEILSLSRISGDSQDMIEEHNRRVEGHKRSSRDAQKRGAKLRLKIRELAMIAEIEDSYEELDKLKQEVQESVAKEACMNELADQWEKLEAKRAILLQVRDLEQHKLPEGAFEDMDKVVAMNELILKWEKLEAQAAILRDGLSKLPAIEEVPELDDRLQRMTLLGREWRRLESIQKVLKEGLSKLSMYPIDDDLSIPEPVLEPMLVTFENLMKQRTKVLSDLQGVRQQLQETDAKLQSLVGHACLTCGQPISEDHIHA